MGGIAVQLSGEACGKEIERVAGVGFMGGEGGARGLLGGDLRVPLQ
jgi:hypothetical protein